MDNPLPSFRRSFRLTLAEWTFDLSAFLVGVKEFARYRTGESARFNPGHKEVMLRTPCIFTLPLFVRAIAMSRRGIIEALATVYEGQPNTRYLTISHFICAPDGRVPFKKRVLSAVVLSGPDRFGEPGLGPKSRSLLLEAFEYRYSARKLLH
jgi:hypothetical protein